MALIPVQHVIAANYPVDPDWDFAVNGTIASGSVVSLDTAGYVTLCNSGNNQLPLGFAGDNLTNAGGATASDANLVIGSSGTGTRWTSNRVSDFFDETVASGEITVYHGGGRFQTTEYEADNFVPGAAIYGSVRGTVTNVVVAAFLIGIAGAAPTAYPSGVPGTDVQGSLSLGNFLDVILQI